MKIINLSCWPATSELIAKGVFEPIHKKAVLALLTFDVVPEDAYILAVANALALTAVAQGATAALVDGPAFITSALEGALLNRNILPLYFYYQRTETPAEDPSEKCTVSQPVCFVPAVATQDLQKRISLDEAWSKV